MSTPVWIFGRLGAAAALATVLIGCAPTAEDGSEKGAPAPGTAGEAQKSPVAAQAQAAPTTETLAHAQLTVPADWTKKTVSSWTVLNAGDGISHVAMGSLEATDVIATKFQEAAAALGASSLVMLDEQATSYGADKLPARAADGACKIGTAESRIGYVVVDFGSGNRVMAVHAAAKDLTDQQLEAGRRTVASLRRR